MNISPELVKRIPELSLIREDGRVCWDWYPKGTYKGQKKDGFYMDKYLQQNLIILAKNIVHDWDFSIIISGRGEVRVGKSVLGLQIMAYWHWLIWKIHGIKLDFNPKNNIVFNGSDLIVSGNRLGQTAKYSVLDYDEAGEDLESDDSGTKKQKEIKKYLRECGQYNLFNIFILPEFFALKNWLALTRTIFLIDVSYDMTESGLFKRGRYRFYSRPNKKKLYVEGKKYLNYNAAPFDFEGQFFNFYPVDEVEYRQMKRDALKGRDDEETDRRNSKLYAAWKIMNEDFGISQKEIAERMTKRGFSYTQKAISLGISLCRT